MLPKVVDYLYYDPGKIIGKANEYNETNQISLDFNIYSELFLPEYYRQNVVVNDNGYVTLSKVMNYTEFEEWSNSSMDEIAPAWCAICEKKQDGYFCDEVIGFNYKISCEMMGYEEEKYPYLTYYAAVKTEEENNWIISEEVMRTHVISMLRYMKNQKISIQ